MREHLWSNLAMMSLAIGVATFFLFDLIALRDPKAMTVSQELREFLSWGPESWFLMIALTAVAVIWLFAHLANPTSP